MTFNSLQATSNFPLYVPQKRDASTSTFESFMEKKFNPSSKIEGAVYRFFKSGEASITANHLESSIKNLHPINLQALLIHARELARANGQTQKIIELTSSLEQLENDKKLKPVNGIPKFNSQLEPKTIHSILKIISLTAGLGFLVLATPLNNLLMYLTPESEKKLTKEVCLNTFTDLTHGTLTSCPHAPVLTKEVCLNTFTDLTHGTLTSCPNAPVLTEEVCLNTFTDLKHGSHLKKLSDDLRSAELIGNNSIEKLKVHIELIEQDKGLLVIALCIAVFAGVYAYAKYKMEVNNNRLLA